MKMKTQMIKWESIKLKKLLSLLLVLLLSLSLIACEALDLVLDEIGELDSGGVEEDLREGQDENIVEDGYYTSKEEVALYLNTYGRLPKNFISKKEAQELGWEANKGNLWEVTDKKSIGGDRFGNRERKLPIKEGRTYYECDINYEGGYRGGERLVYSNDGLIYYTGDHYNSFSLLYGDE